MLINIFQTANRTGTRRLMGYLAINSVDRLGRVFLGVFGVCLVPKLVLLMRNSGKRCGMRNR